MHRAPAARGAPARLVQGHGIRHHRRPWRQRDRQLAHPGGQYRIPVFVYSPAHVPARRVDRLMSQIDIAPTLLGLLDFTYYTKFLGNDLLHSPPGSSARSSPTTRRSAT